MQIGKEYLELSGLKELGKAEIQSEEAMKEAFEFIQHMKKSVLEICEEAGEDFLLSNIMEDQKEIRFMESMLKEMK